MSVGRLADEAGLPPVECPFCKPSAAQIAFRTADILGIWDGFPVTEGHLLIVPARHALRWDDLNHAEQAALLEGVDRGRALLKGLFGPDAFNVGYNDGQAAGQTVPHFHIHIIPRRAGDVADPRGGVRHVISGKGNYLAPVPATGAPDQLATAPHRLALISGSEDPLLPHLVRHIDDAAAVDVAVAFIMESGARLLLPHLRDLLARGGRLRFIAGDYLDVTDPSALRHLLDLDGQVERLVFEAGRESFHLKSWVFHRGDGHGLAIVGSSNISETALLKGIEWNYRACSSETEGWRDVIAGYDTLLNSPRIRPLTYDWIDGYEARRSRTPIRQAEAIGVPEEQPPPAPEPHEVQRNALAALRRARADGYSAGLVVLATGLGKTWLSAFDTAAPEFRRVLFVAHRDEILSQAMETFRQCRPQARLGRYDGIEKDPTADVVFASVQTLGRSAHLERFSPDYFDYIVVDEFHHAAARTYRQLIDHFTPKFLLGLTATPERTDGGDLLGLCQENLVFRCDAFEAIDKQLLSPFRYFGIPDEVDYANIPWRSSRFDEVALTAAVATEARAQNALEQHRRHGGTRALGFCCSTVHADYMADFFNKHGVRAAAVHSAPGSAPRTSSLEALRGGDLEVVFSVDMFNEGVDVPSVDTVLMLRPTESVIIWLQQFGRGLRLSPGKTHLNVIDYIGNHRTFLTKVRALLGVEEGDRALALALESIRLGRAELPPGCEVTYELEALDILQNLLRRTTEADALEAYYLDFRERHGLRPTAQEIHHAGFNPRSTGHGGWLGFVRHQGDLNDLEREAARRHAAFLAMLERTPMTRSYKMLLLKAMQHADAFPGRIGIDQLTDAFGRLARQNPVYSRDVSVSLDNRLALQRLLLAQPIAAWVGQTAGAEGFFAYENGEFATNFTATSSERPALIDLTREILDWRLADYLRRGRDVEDTEPHLAGVAETSQGWTGAELWREYMREQIPPLYGHTFSTGSWNQGFVVQGKDVFLLATLNKDDLVEAHRYEDGFSGPSQFRWQSQNQTSPQSRAGRIISGQEPGYAIHLFVRATKKRGQAAAPFIYCGDVDFVDWEGSQPISVTWRLPSPVPSHLNRMLQVPSQAP